MSDNGFSYVKNRSLRELLARHGIHHLTTLPYRPRTTGKLERFHQTMAREWAYGPSYRSHRQPNQALPDWLLLGSPRSASSRPLCTPTVRAAGLAREDAAAVRPRGSDRESLTTTKIALTVPQGLDRLVRSEPGLAATDAAERLRQPRGNHEGDCDLDRREGPDRQRKCPHQPAPSGLAHRDT
jgi:hypothetical protein